ARMPSSSAIVARNRKWTAIVPLDGASVDAAFISVNLGQPVVQIFFDEDSTLTVRFYDGKVTVGEFSIPLDGSYEFADEDGKLIDELAQRAVVTKTAAHELRKWLERGGAEVAQWGRAHQFEALLDLPLCQIIRFGTLAEGIAEQIPKAEIV